jgi:hypothetical protein
MGRGDICKLTVGDWALAERRVVKAANAPKDKTNSNPFFTAAFP